MMTNAGLSICLPVVQTISYYLAILNAQRLHAQSPEKHAAYGYPSSNFYAAIPIRGRLEELTSTEGDDLQPGIMERMSFPPEPISIQPMWSLCQPELFIRSRPGARWFDDCCARYERLELPFKYGFLMIFDNIRVMAKSPAEDVVYRGEPMTELDEHLLRLKPSPLDQVFLTERIGPTDPFGIIRNNSITTHPPGLFDSERGLILWKTSSSSSGVLVRLGSGKDACVLFLGIKKSHHSSQPLRFCKILSADPWDRGHKHLSKTLQIEEDRVRGAEESCPRHHEDGYSVVTNEGKEVRSGLFFLTYIHHV